MFQANPCYAIEDQIISKFPDFTIMQQHKWNLKHNAYHWLSKNEQWSLNKILFTKKKY
jgi:hypothetical protein